MPKNIGLHPVVLSFVAICHIQRLDRTEALIAANEISLQMIDASYTLPLEEGETLSTALLRAEHGSSERLEQVRHKLTDIHHIAMGCNADEASIFGKPIGGYGEIASIAASALTDIQDTTEGTA